MTRRKISFALAALCCAVLGTPILLSAEPKADAKADPKADSPAAGPAAALHGFRWKFPCKEIMPDQPKPGADCVSALVTGDPNKTDNFKAEVNFGGEKGKHYDVTLRFRGVVEPMMYKDGKMDGDYFYIGGVPNNGTYNIYKIEIASPKSHYFLNRQDKVGHQIFTIDYTKTIRIEGGSAITLSGDGQNGRLISNFKKLTIPEIAPEPFNGQFVQMDVVKVEEVKEAK